MTYLIIKAVHVTGIVLWCAGLLACIYLLTAHAEADGGRSALSGRERKAAVLMDIGATVAMATGFYIAIALIPAYFKQGWLHIKLTLVILGLLAIHGFVRVKIRKFRNGEIKPLPAVVLPVTIAVMTAIIVVVTVKPFAQ